MSQESNVHSECSSTTRFGTAHRLIFPSPPISQVILEEKVLTAQVERGMASDAEVRFERESEQSPGVTPGDVIFKFRQAAHPRFRRDRDDLHFDMHLTLKEALVGE